MINLNKILTISASEYVCQTKPHANPRLEQYRTVGVHGTNLEDLAEHAPEGAEVLVSLIGGSSGDHATALIYDPLDTSGG